MLAFTQTVGLIAFWLTGTLAVAPSDILTVAQTATLTATPTTAERYTDRFTGRYPGSYVNAIGYTARYTDGCTVALNETATQLSHKRLRKPLH